MKFGFGCQSGVGKDEACEYLKKNYGGMILHFSDPIYEIMNFAQNTCKFERKKDRQFLQYIGTDWARSINPEVWINSLMDKILEMKSDPLALKKDISNIYVGDVRFKNEASALKNKGFICVLIINPNRQLLNKKENTHISENDAFTYFWDDVIVNDGTLEEFHKKLELLVKKYTWTHFN